MYRTFRCAGNDFSAVVLPREVVRRFATKGLCVQNHRSAVGTNRVVGSGLGRQVRVKGDVNGIDVSNGIAAGVFNGGRS